MYFTNNIYPRLGFNILFINSEASSNVQWLNLSCFDFNHFISKYDKPAVILGKIASSFLLVLHDNLFPLCQMYLLSFPKERQKPSRILLVNLISLYFYDFLALGVSFLKWTNTLFHIFTISKRKTIRAALKKL